jgi:16S rRNA (guanine966-N2)-methyltransferase
MATKIIGGRFRSTTLATPKGKVARPTLGRIRENLFNLLRERVERADFLDLYAGLGAVGLEALSRGARRCVFVENARPCLAAIEQNIAQLKVQDCSEVLRISCFRALQLLEKRGEQFDCLFADPPYRRGWALRVLNAVEDSGLWRENALVILQTERENLLPTEAGKLALERRVDYGSTSLWLYRPADA